MPAPPYGSAIPFNSPINLNGLDVENAKWHMVNGDVGTPEEGQTWFNYATHLFKGRDDALVRTFITSRHTLDQITAPAQNVDLNAKRIVNMANAVNPQDAATLADVQATVSGLDVKLASRAATTAALPANTYSNGAAGVGATLTGISNGALPSQDGVTLIVGDRLLVKNEVSTLKNGIYTLTQVGTGALPYILTRATDADQNGAGAEVTQGLFTLIAEGTTLAGSAWYLQTGGTIVLGTTGLVFVQFLGSLQLAGDGTTIVISGGVVSIYSNYIGQASITTLGTITTGTWNGTTIAIARGGTGATTALAARTALGVAQKGFAGTYGDGSTTAIAVAHALNTLDVVVQAYIISTGQEFNVDVVRTNVNTVTLNFTVAPASNTIRVVVVPVTAG